MTTLPVAPIDVALLEWEEATPAQRPELRRLSFDADPSVREEADRLRSANMLIITERYDGLSVEALSWVGTIALGPLRVTISPKVGNSLLIRLLRYTYGLRNLRLFARHEAPTEALAFTDLLIHQLAAEAQQILRQGLHREYKQREASLGSPRGQILFAQHIANGGSASATLPCRFHERREDHLANQVLLAGLRLAVRMIDDIPLRGALNRLLQTLAAEVTEITLTPAVFAELDRKTHRLLAYYEPAFELIQLLFEGSGASTRGPERQTLSGFLFDMNLFFQRLLSRFLNENLEGYAIQGEHSLRGVFRYDPTPDGTFRRRDPIPRPDFAILRGGIPITFLDAKYRDLATHSLPREILYQLAIYSLSRSDCPRSAILYPTINPSAREARIAVLDSVSGNERSEVVLRPIDLEYFSRVVADDDSAHHESARRRLALRLAGVDTARLH